MKQPSSFEVFEDQHDRPAYAVFEGSIPTERDAIYIARKKMTMRLLSLPPEDLDLAFLGPFAHRIIKLEWRS